MRRYRGQDLDSSDNCRSAWERTRESTRRPNGLKRPHESAGFQIECDDGICRLRRWLRIGVAGTDVEQLSLRINCWGIPQRAASGRIELYSAYIFPDGLGCLWD